MITNKKHIAFIDAYFLNGFRAGPAYASVYKDVTAASADVLGCNLLKNIKVDEEIKRRQTLITEKVLVTKEELIKDLLDIRLAQKDILPATSVKAIELITKMLGFLAPTQSQAEVTITKEQDLFGPLT